MGTPESENTAARPENRLAPRVRAYLCDLLAGDRPITYQALAKDLQLSPPNTIQQLTEALECLIEEDAAAGHPLIAALVVSRARGGLPAPGFFERAYRAGRLHSDPAAFYVAEFADAATFWCRSTSP